MPLALADVSASVHACKGEQKVRDAERKIRRLKSALKFFVINYRLKPVAWIVHDCVINYGLKSVA
jgi:hypothetical protein